MEHFRVPMIIVAAGLLVGAMFVASEAAEIRGHVVNPCQSLAVKIKKQGKVSVGQSGAHSVQGCFAGLRAKVNANPKYVFSAEYASHVASCKADYQRWLDYNNRLEALLAQFKRMGCAGR